MDYYVRYGGDGFMDCNRTEYLTKRQAEKEYEKIKLNTKTTWKELWYEPLDEEEGQHLIKQEEVKVFDFGTFGKLAVPQKN